MVSLVGQVETTHEDMVHDAQLDYYGTKLATCSSDRYVKIFSVTATGSSTLIGNLHGHDGAVWQIAWAHPTYGTVLASCGYDKKIIVWKETVSHSNDTAGGAQSNLPSNSRWDKIYEHKDHLSSVNSVCWAPYDLGLVLAAGSSDGSISVHTYQQQDGSWEVKKINNAHSLGCNTVSWAPSTPPNAMFEQPTTASSEHSSLASTNIVRKIVSGGCDKLVRIWTLNATTGEWETSDNEKLEAHADWVRDVAWAPNIGLSRSLIASCGQDKCVYLWQQDKTGKWVPRQLRKFDDVIYHLSWSLLGNILAVSSGDNTVTLWKELADGQWVCLTDVAKSVLGTDHAQQQQPAMAAVH